MATTVSPAQSSVCQTLYQNTSLRKGRTQVRLLLLQSGLHRAPVVCSLFLTELSSTPVYQALSYTWGSRTDSELITLNQYPFKVTHNLYDALQDIRMTSRGAVIWIDALCINQDDIMERNEQVGQMTAIYQQASRVLIWLGPALTTDMRAAIEFLKQWPSSCLVATDKGERIYKVDQLTGSEEATYPFMTTDQLRGLLQILQRPWFSRGWVVQEVTVAKQAICGLGPVDSGDSAWASWSTLFEASGHIMQAMLNHYEGDVVQFGLATTQLGTMKELREASLQQGLMRLDFEDYVRACQNFATTDPRDKIFALLGLAGDSGSLGLIPDYNESPQSLFMRATKAVCRAAQSLDLLTLHLRPSLDGLPSWARDFSSSLTSPFVLTDLKYAASCGSAPLPRRTGVDLPHQMYIRGRRIGVIKHTIPIKLKLSVISAADAGGRPDCHQNAHFERLDPPPQSHYHLEIENFDELYKHMSINNFTEHDQALLSEDSSLVRVQLIRNLWIILSAGRNSLGGEEVSLGNDCQYGVWNGCASDTDNAYSLGFGANINTSIAYLHRFTHLKSYYERQISMFIAPHRASQDRHFFVTDKGDLGCVRKRPSPEILFLWYMGRVCHSC